MKEEAQREREREKKKKESERERRRKVEEERKEGSGVTSILDWKLKVAGSIPGSTHREIIHNKTTLSLTIQLNISHLITHS